MLGHFQYPIGGAASNNLRGHSQAIQRAGYSVGFLPNQSSGRPEDQTPAGEFVFAGSRYWPIKRAHPPGKIKKYLRAYAAWDDDCLAWLATRPSLAGVKAIIYYAGVKGTVPFLMRLRRFCRVNKLKLFSYVVEWHEPKRDNDPRMFLDTLDAEFQRRVINLKLDGIICISNYLSQYYAARGCNTCLIPALLDLADIQWAEQERVTNPAGDSGLRLVFSGNSRRERHDLILQAVLAARNQGAEVVIEFVGSTEKDILSIPRVDAGLVKKLGPAVRFHGFVSYGEMLKIVSSASFGSLLRENHRWSRACFPSKVPEMFAMGLPMISNLTSDLKDYLVDGENALVVESLSAEAMTQALLRAAALDGNRQAEMRKNARLTARRFDGIQYASVYQKLLAGI